jgi:hypothetical protein
VPFCIVADGWTFLGSPWASVIIVALLSEGGLLSSPRKRVLDGRASWRTWRPIRGCRIARASERLAMRNGVMLMAGRVLALIYARGTYQLVVMYSINVLDVLALQHRHEPAMDPEGRAT